MPSGGHSRSGPAPRPGSGRSDARGLKFKGLPSEGYSGAVPEFPRQVVFGTELSHWERVWRTPQAALWASDQWSWVVPAVAHYCALMAQSELADCPVGVHAQIRGRETDILLSSDALARAGYQVVSDELQEKRDAVVAPVRVGARARHQVG